MMMFAKMTYQKRYIHTKKEFKYTKPELGVREKKILSLSPENARRGLPEISLHLKKLQIKYQGGKAPYHENCTRPSPWVIVKLIIRKI